MISKLLRQKNWSIGPNHPEVHDFKRFVNQRAASVRRQLDGKSRGMILKYPEKK